jgi:hypothetical protein
MDALFDVYFGAIGVFSFVKFTILVLGSALQCQGLACG